MPSYLSSRAVQVGVACLLTIPVFAIPRNIDRRAQSAKPPPKGPLFVTAKIPTTVMDVGKFEIELTLVNTGDKPLSVVKDPDGPLFDKLPTYAWDFHLEGKTAAKTTKQPIVDGADRPTFIGAFINWSLDTYLSKLKPSLRKEDIPVAEKKSGKMEDTEITKGGDGSASPDKLIALKKGETKKIIYKVGNAYDFSKSGAGTYSVKSVRESFWITPDGGKTIEEVKVAPVKQTVKISGKLSATNLKASAKSSDTTVVEKRALRTTECSEYQVAIIRRSADHAIDYARESLTYMSASTGDRPRYTYWFGPWDHTRAAPNNVLLVRTSVTYAYHVMNLRSFVHGYTYDCSCDLQTTAYVAPRLFQNPVINLCPGFWQEDFPFTGHLSRAGVLIHEASHFLDVAGTKDHSYEYTDSHQFAVTNPEIAVNNANNFKFFSENVEGRE